MILRKPGDCLILMLPFGIGKETPRIVGFSPWSPEHAQG
jgi:hypothetical protein